MATTAHTHVRHVGLRRPANGSVSAAVPGERPSPGAADSEERAWPTGSLVWNWAESVALLGYGPPASSFL
ncbi:hypothetical protein ACWEWG_01745 [Streptomyces sp. NPDC003758]|uniref:Uncharacterized protein n=1 Tax=Streptomyces cynarae TaxID=2981134 RepID=A0ABY6DW39_9ACTN|nr:hypothetical protein [Streptomyces cynarae]UXY17918.1 hypothetical protein N8I84_03600 [Streptomyces cynarae]